MDSLLLLEDSTNLTLEGPLSWYILLEESTGVADQVEIQLPKTQVNEGAVFTATAYFRTRATKKASTPTNAYYRIDGLTTDTVLVDWTAISVPATNNAITITAAVNNIQNDSNRSERRQITVQADRGLTTLAVGTAFWTVRNLVGS